MRLIIEPAASWIVEELGDARRIRIGGVSLDISPITPLPDNASSWAQSVLRADLPPSTVLEVVMATDLTTSDGWRITVIESQVHAVESKQIVESRLHLFYSLLFYGAVAIARSDNADELEAHRSEILDTLGRARPDFNGPIVALAQVYAP